MGGFGWLGVLLDLMGLEGSKANGLNKVIGVYGCIKMGGMLDKREDDRGGMRAAELGCGVNGEEEIGVVGSIRRLIL